MKSKLIVLGIVVIITVNLFSISVHTNLVNAKVICVDKYNNASIIPCSDQNAIVEDSIKSSHISAGSNATAGIPGGNMTVNTAFSNQSSRSMMATNGMAPNVKSNFVIYKNSGFGIKIIHPSDWTIQENVPYNSSLANGPRDIVRFNAPEVRFNSTSPYVAVDSSSSNLTPPNLTTLEQLLHYSMNVGLGDPNFKVISANTNARLNGQPSYILVFETSDLTNGKEVEMQVGNYNYSLLYWATKPYYSTYLPTAEKMIQSFGFESTANASPINNPSNNNKLMPYQTPAIRDPKSPGGFRCPPGQGLNMTLCIPVQTSSGPSTPTTSSPQPSYASTQGGPNANTTYSNCLAQYGLDVNNQGSNPRAITICGKEAYPWLYPHANCYWNGNIICPSGSTSGGSSLTPTRTLGLPSNFHHSGHTAAYNQGFSDGTTSARNSGINDPGSACDSYGYKGRDCNHYLQGYADGFNSSCASSRFGCDGQGNPKLAP